ncbi:hypothetical protein EK21DRAFT_105868 [Setomelanomma holmii]|uniref:Uncharacterized protein n=1 Tax=Setomelanomma holmii TaxID=210430 RepID=A0A9P4HM69_9PLEO|nr:hypothetical protein EK21DRAFT_105868 [Setomelanomma holmii]
MAGNEGATTSRDTPSITENAKGIGKRKAKDAGVQGGEPAPKASKTKGGKRTAKTTNLIDCTVGDDGLPTEISKPGPVDQFADDIPYFYRKGIQNMFKNFFPTLGNDDDDDDADDDFDGFNAAMAIEETYEARVETLAHDVAINLQTCEPILVGDIHGKWNMYSPNYLDLREVAARFSKGAPRHYRDWKTGTLEIGDEQGNPAILSSQVVGALRLDGLEHNWRVFMDVPEFVEMEGRACRTVKKTFAGSQTMDSEITVGVYFFGEGLMKMKINGVSLGRREETNRWVTLYGVREGS